MSLSKKNSLSLSFFKARLSPFTKPMFLGSITVFLLLGVSIWQYWKHPEWRGVNKDLPKTTEANLKQLDLTKSVERPSQEELAAGVDLGDSRSLLEALQKNNLDTKISTKNTSNKKQEEIKSTGLLAEMMKKNKEQTKSDANGDKKENKNPIGYKSIQEVINESSPFKNSILSKNNSENSSSVPNYSILNQNKNSSTNRNFSTNTKVNQQNSLQEAINRRVKIRNSNNNNESFQNSNTIIKTSSEKMTKDSFDVQNSNYYSLPANKNKDLTVTSPGSTYNYYSPAQTSTPINSNNSGNIYNSNNSNSTLPNYNYGANYNNNSSLTNNSPSNTGYVQPNYNNNSQNNNINSQQNFSNRPNNQNNGFNNNNSFYRSPLDK